MCFVIIVSFICLINDHSIPLYCERERERERERESERERETFLDHRSHFVVTKLEKCSLFLIRQAQVCVPYASKATVSLLSGLFPVKGGGGTWRHRKHGVSVCIIHRNSSKPLNWKKWIYHDIRQEYYHDVHVCVKCSDGQISC